jgi:hypothetical protein
VSGRNPFDGILFFGIVVGVIGVLLVAALVGLGWWIWTHVQWVP